MQTTTRKLLPTQYRFVMSMKEENLLSGAWGSGKTRALCEKLLRMCIEWPGNRVGLFRKEDKSLRATTLVTLLEGDGVLPPVLPEAAIVKHDKRPYGRIVVRAKGGTSEIVYGGLSQKGLIQSWVKGLNLGGFCVDQGEELTWDDYVLLLGRMRSSVPKVRQACMAVNPDGPGHWIHRRFFDNPTDGMWAESTSSFDNPFLPLQYRNLLRGLKGRYYQRYALGLWVGFEGLVYPNLDLRIHEIEPFEIPKEWPRYMSWDFGYVHPASVAWYAHDLKEDKMYMYRELYVTGQLVRDLAKQAAELSRGEPKPRAVYCDHDAQERAILDDAWKGHGVYTRPANKAVLPGIQEVYQRLGNEEQGEKSEPRLYFFKDALVYPDESLLFSEGGEKRATRIIESMQMYEWLTGNKEAPRKVEDDGADNCRYMINSLFGVAQKPVPQYVRGRMSLPIDWKSPVRIGPW